MLLGVQSVGPKVALAVLSGGPPRELLAAVAAGDTARLQAVPGIGKRTAERIVVELREKVDGALPAAEITITRADDPRSLAREGLIGLGYSAAEADELLERRRGRAARGPDRGRAEDGAAMSAISESGERADPRPAGPAARRGARPLAAPPAAARTSSARSPSRTSSRSRSPRPAGRGEALDHVLLAGPPGLGKTSLAQIVAAELDVQFVQTAGPALERKADIAALLTALEPRAVFFVDEIHRLPRALEETFYPAMEDRSLPITVGQGAGARVITLDLPPFTLIGATTRAGLLTTPLRDRFGIQHRLEHYGPEESGDRSSAARRGCSTSSIDDGGAAAIAQRSRGTPRVANRLLKRVRDYVEVRGSGVVTAQRRPRRSTCSQVDHEGLDRLDREILRAICEKFGGGPVGLSTLAVAVGEEPDTIEDVYEPYLLQRGLIERTPRGRAATKRAFAHLGLELNGPLTLL